MSAARHVGRRFVPPPDAVPVVAIEEPGRERPRVVAREVFPRPVQGSFTSRFPVSSRSA